MKKMFSIDSLVNFVSGLGTTKDKATQSQYIFNQLDQGQLEAAYRSDWVAQKVVNIPARDSTRAWRDWKTSKENIEKIEAEEKRLNLKLKTMQALVKARLYGGSAIVIGVNGTTDPSEPLITDTLSAGCLKYLHVVTRHEIQVQELDLDVTSDFYGEPLRYIVQPIGRSPVQVHPSRVVRFQGVELVNINQSSDGWGDSILQSLDDAIKNVGITSASVATLIHESKIDILSIPGFMAQISQKEYKDRLLERITLANTSKSLINAMLLDAEEKWQRNQISFTGMPEILMMYLTIASGAADIPVTRFLGQSAKGLNATGEGDAANYIDKIKSDQELFIDPSLSRLDEVMLRSALGERDPSIHYEWSDLWQLSDAERADIATKKANVFKIDVESNVIEPDILRTARINQLIEDGTYPGLDEAVEEHETMGIDEDDPEAVDQFEKIKGAEPEPVEVADAEPRTLYVRRDVVNVQDIVDWAKSVGFEKIVDPSKMHVTIVFSRKPLDWMKIREGYDQESNGQLRVAPGGPRLVERLGPTKDAIVLMFASSSLCWRHECIQEGGASWDWPEYQPHITISFDAPDVDVSKIEPYRGAIVLGPEIFEEVKEDWKETIVEVKA